MVRTQAGLAELQGAADGRLGFGQPAGGTKHFAQCVSQASGRQTIRRGFMFMGAASIANLAYAFATAPALPWAVLHMFVYGIGFAMIMPSIVLITLDLFPTRRGMAASLQGFVSGMVNVVTAGVIAPAVFHDTRALAVTMVLLAACGLACWTLYLRSARSHVDEPPTTFPEPKEAPDE